MASEFLTTALDAARAAAEVIRRYYQQNLAVTVKADKSPVTQADVETEQVIRSLIASRHPTHGFYGEETGQSALDAEYLCDACGAASAVPVEQTLCCPACGGRVDVAGGNGVSLLDLDVALPRG